MTKDTRLLTVDLSFCLTDLAEKNIGQSVVRGFWAPSHIAFEKLSVKLWRPGRDLDPGPAGDSRIYYSGIAEKHTL